MQNRKAQFFIFLVYLALCNIQLAEAQYIVVKNAENLKPIENVLAFTTGHAELSNIKGIIDLSSFAAGDTVSIQHPSYRRASIVIPDVVSGPLELLLMEKTIRLDELVISVNRWEQNLDHVPASVEKINLSDIEFYNPQTSADMLASSGTVYVQKSQMGGGSPIIRGFAANRVLLTFDGIRLNNAIYRSGNLQNILSVDANNLEQTEVIFGPGTVQYGSDAIGGVVNMFSKRIIFTDDSKGEWKGSAMSRYATANNESTTHGDITWANDRLGFATSMTFSAFGDLKMGNHGRQSYLRHQYVTRLNGADSILINRKPRIQRFSGYDQFNVSQKVKLRVNEHLTTVASFHYSQLGEVPRYDRLVLNDNSGQPVYAEWSYGPQKWMLARLSLKYQHQLPWFDAMNVNLAYQRYVESRIDRKLNSNSRLSRTEGVNKLTLSIDFSKALGTNNSVFYGLDVGRDQVSSNGVLFNIVSNVRSITSSRYPDGSTYSNYGLYFNFSHQVSQQVSWQTGIRFSQYFTRARFDTTFYSFPVQELKLSPGAVIGSAGLVIEKPADIMKIQASTGYRSPNIDDVAKVFDSEPGNVVVPNSGLRAEYAYSVDLGHSHVFNAKVKVAWNAYVTWLDRALIRRNTTFNGKDSIFYDGTLSRVQTLVNAGNAFVYGGNMSVQAEISNNLSLYSTINYTRGHDNEHLPLRHVSPLFGDLHLVFRSNRYKVDLFSIFNGEIGFDNMAISELNKPHIYAQDNFGRPFSPGWVTMNIRASCQLTHIIQVDAGIENIFNLRYRPYSSGIVSAGRNFSVTLRAYF